MDFKESGFMYALGGFIVIFVLAQSLFFLIRAWKQGKKLGLSTATMRGTVTQSALFSLAPAISIVATILTLSGALGIVLRALGLDGASRKEAVKKCPICAFFWNFSAPVCLQ